MAIRPPEQRVWWNEPIQRGEIIWIAIAFLWGVFMFLFMIWWHFTGQQNLSNEAYRVDPGRFAELTQAFADEHTVREEGDTGIPGGASAARRRRLHVRPAMGVVAGARAREGPEYRLHLSSLDWQHGFSLQPVNMNIQVHPGYEMVLTITPTETGEFGVVCNEYCGIGHHTMVGRIYVVEPGQGG